MRDTKYDARPLGKPASRSSACGGSSKQTLERSGALAIYRELADLLAHTRTGGVADLTPDNYRAQLEGWHHAVSRSDSSPGL